MNKNTFQVGDLVDVKPELKPYATTDLGFAVIVGNKYPFSSSYREKFYTLMWPTGETSIVQQKNIQLAE